MDILTQGLLGAVAAQATWGHRIGRRAALVGAIAGIVPDVDVLFGIASDPFTGLIMHRGFTHSLWFPFLCGPLVGLLYWRWRLWRTGKDMSLTGCVGAAFAGMMTHGLLDAFTSYGTQLLSPFSDHRFAFHGVSIVDIAYTATLLIGMIIALCWNKRARLVASLSLILTTSYLGMGVLINEMMIDTIQEQVGPKKRIWVSPAFMQPLYRRVVFSDEKEVCVGYRHFLHLEDQGNYVCRPRTNDPRITKIKDSREGKIFQWFSDDLLFEWIENLPDGRSIAVIGDARFGLTNDPLEPLWGIYAHFDAAQKQVSVVDFLTTQQGSKAFVHTANSHFFKGYFYSQMKAYGLLEK